MKTEMEILKETVINLLMENTTLKADLKKSEESDQYWFKRYKETKEELDSLKPEECKSEE
jgi:hypothetical protein